MNFSHPLTVHTLRTRAWFTGFCTVPALNYCTECVRNRTQYATAPPIPTLFPGHLCIDDLTNDQEHIFDSQTSWINDVQGTTLRLALLPGASSTVKNRVSGKFMA